MNDTEIETERIRLRLIDISDLDSIHTLHSLPETDKYNALGIPNSTEETKAIIEPWIKENQSEKIKTYTFAIVNKSNGKFMGLFGFKVGHQKYKRAEVWYKIHSDYWKKGYATEALKAILDFGFDTLNLHRIEAGCAVENIGSIKVLEKSGMVREGRLRQILPLKSGWSDNFQYAILESDVRSK
tara:strand:+ start:723 stop:1274 length:552 start_codon:yes stop_codon:yes gene_type:complete